MWRESEKVLRVLRVLRGFPLHGAAKGITPSVRMLPPPGPEMGSLAKTHLEAGCRLSHLGVQPDGTNPLFHYFLAGRFGSSHPRVCKV